MHRIDSTDISELGINAVKVLDDGNLYYMKEYKDTIKDLDIYNFNYIVFEEDIDNMVYIEFDQYFRTDFIEILDFFNEYLYIDVEAISNLENNTNSIEMHKMMVKNIIKFLMMILPYTHLKGVLSKHEIEGFHEALEVVSTITIKDQIINEIELAKSEQHNFNNLMSNIQETITNKNKKDKFTDMIQVLDVNIQEKIKVFDYYISIINSSGRESLSELLKLYIKKDSRNIL